MGKRIQQSKLEIFAHEKTQKLKHKFGEFRRHGAVPFGAVESRKLSTQGSFD